MVRLWGWAALIGCMLFWRPNQVLACSPPAKPVPAVEVVGIAAETIPRNGAILITLSSAPLSDEQPTLTVLSGGAPIDGTLTPWPIWALWTSRPWHVAWVPDELLPADARLTFRFEMGLSPQRPQSERALQLERVVRTTSQLAPPIIVGDISVRAERRGRPRPGYCASSCGPCETVGVDYHFWAELTVPRPQGGWPVGGYALIPWFDESGEYTTSVRSEGDAYGVMSETGEGTVSLFLAPSERAYRPCFTAEVRSLSGSARSAPVCLPAGKSRTPRWRYAAGGAQ
jgi:hypothetical protein